MKRLIAPIFAVMFGFCAICAYVLLEARHITYDRAGDVASSLVAAIEADISRNIETVDLSLQAVVENLNLPGIERMDPELRRKLLFDRSASARHVGKIIVLDEGGNLRLDSTTLEPQPLNLADRDYFLVHKNSTDAGMYVSRPAISRFEGFWFTAISRRLSHPDGSFGGVAVASLRLSYFEQLFKNIALGPDGTVTLSRTDGIVLMRWPFKEEFIGLDLHSAKIFEHLAQSRSGRFEAYSATDGVQRLIVYSQIGAYPLVVGVGQTKANIYAQWYEYAFSIVFLIAILCTLTFLVAIYLAHELGRRRDAEAKLAILAATDALTGLSNRRHFNEILGREWQRGMRDQSPLAMLMLDADKFKPYNDSHGHQAGDAMLKAIGAAIASALNRGGDIGARYGGDEFAILLPGTSLDGAKRVADKVRLAFSDFCQRERMTNLGLSIGVSCIMPGKSVSSGDLVGLADQALYSAKHLGRNRTELAAQVDAPAFPSDSHKAA